MFQPLIVACNKTDIRSLEELSQIDSKSRQLISDIENDNIPVMELSTLTQAGVMDVKTKVDFI